MGKGILERLDEGVIIGDGGFVVALEKRGYVQAGPWTPEAVIEHPEAVLELHREFLRAGSDVMQCFTFYASEDKLTVRGNKAGRHGSTNINEAACLLAREVANEGDALIAGGMSQTPTYAEGGSKEAVQEHFQKQADAFTKCGVDFLICEYFEHAEEACWAVEICKKTGLAVAATLCINKEGDVDGVPTSECAVRLANAGADIIGINCNFDPDTVLAGVREMKRGLEEAGLKRHLITQPLGYRTPDANKHGFVDIPEFPFAMEPRTLTRWDCHRYAREAYDLGVRYIGACCGFEPYHVRAIAEELVTERGGKLPLASEKHEMWGGGLKLHTKPWVRARASREYWENLRPATGRPECPAYSKPSSHDITD
ncbi:Betaine--homocysteine S-methyltransferase 1 [Trichoplax sp. H2]|uniref:Hcy-binding domain-containing protein n=1 Tax=Trichoplax adhaerens TaxID=10228 RepID=B3RR63_TRIAD|nr:expressed hypothetical protein [Trichoplax adhaerens]EDV26822.1 expressed hypothetical protein [Trichoplax adhaerens]RDD45139.1 Betaine--homocysteine S-methyltransferase 1 [Trichoplax sp. H2]|eukprot:XP_002110818.1 expressed hypothetical protein [Trichoplax adhaerens]